LRKRDYREYARKGSFVSRISIKDIREIFEIREILECEAIKRIVQMRDPAKIEAIRKRFESSETETVIISEAILRREIRSTASS